MADSFLKRGY